VATLPESTLEISKLKKYANLVLSANFVGPKRTADEAWHKAH
jgi:hypothetical protein